MVSPDAGQDLFAGPYLERLAEFLGKHSFPERAGFYAERARNRVVRDLLPRIQDPIPCLIVGIIGPNNSGKSTIFNALAADGQVLSPVSPSGGYTRQLIGAAQPELLLSVRESLGRRFRVQTIEGGGKLPGFAQDASPEQLLLVAHDCAPSGHLLIDAPDIDSIFRENRKAGDALVVTADLLVGVVTRHTYQNEQVVAFLSEAVGYGRPYCLVYNEAPSADVAAEHLEKLAADIGEPPIRRFFARHDLRVQEGSAALDPLAFPREGADGGASLNEWLRVQDEAALFHEQAHLASFRGLSRDLERLRVTWEEATRGPRIARERIHRTLHAHAADVARALFPAAPFREALEQYLDERSRFHRGVRRPFRYLRRAVKGTYAFLRRGLRRRVEPLSSVETFQEKEFKHLLGRVQKGENASAVHRLWELLNDELLSAPRALSRPAVEGDFDPKRSAMLEDELRTSYHAAPPPFEEFRKDCRELICQEIERRNGKGGVSEATLQWLHNGLEVLPPVAAVTITFFTGMFGDLGAIAGAVIAGPMLERILGRELVGRIQQSWSQERTVALASILERTLAPRCVAELDELLGEFRSARGPLRSFLADLAAHLKELDDQRNGA